eukprot:UN29449
MFPLCSDTYKDVTNYSDNTIDYFAMSACVVPFVLFWLWHGGLGYVLHDNASPLQFWDNNFVTKLIKSETYTHKADNNDIALFEQPQKHSNVVKYFEKGTKIHGVRKKTYENVNYIKIMDPEQGYKGWVLEHKLTKLPTSYAEGKEEFYQSVSKWTHRANIAIWIDLLIICGNVAYIAIKSFHDDKYSKFACI